MGDRERVGEGEAVALVRDRDFVWEDDAIGERVIVRLLESEWEAVTVAVRVHDVVRLRVHDGDRETLRDGEALPDVVREVDDDLDGERVKEPDPDAVRDVDALRDDDLEGDPDVERVEVRDGTDGDELGDSDDDGGDGDWDSDTVGEGESLAEALHVAVDDSVVVAEPELDNGDAPKVSVGVAPNDSSSWGSGSSEADSAVASHIDSAPTVTTSVASRHCVHNVGLADITRAG